MIVIYRCFQYSWIWIFFMISALRADCPYEKCDCYGTDIYCTYNEMQTLQLNTNRKTTGFTSLDLESTSVTAITSGSLPGNLTELYLMDSPITIIEDSALNGSATSLKMFTISNISLTRIPDAFLILRNIQQLSIERMHIVDWNDEVMKNIGLTVKKLYLDTVFLTTPPSWLQYFNRLTDLTILGSFLSSFPDNSMNMLANSLTSMTLYNNSLTEVPKAFSILHSLQSLDLEKNSIASTYWLPSSSKLVSLTLSDNNIYNATELIISLSPYATSLKDLDLEDNELTALPELSLFYNIESISFIHNKLSDTNSGSMPPYLYYIDLHDNMFPAIPKLMSGLKSITDLVLSSNVISVIQGEDFPANVTAVELGFNLITELTDTSFPVNSIIESLYLNNNPLSKISLLAFQNLNKLSELSLQGTQLTRLPLALSSLVHLYNFDITLTPGLVCTCLEKSLQTWVISLGPENVSGNCGQMTVYNFFAILSPGCPAE